MKHVLAHAKQDSTPNPSWVQEEIAAFEFLIVAKKAGLELTEDLLNDPERVICQAEPTLEHPGVYGYWLDGQGWIANHLTAPDRAAVLAKALNAKNPTLSTVWALSEELRQ